MKILPSGFSVDDVPIPQRHFIQGRRLQYTVIAKPYLLIKPLILKYEPATEDCAISPTYIVLEIDSILGS